MIGNLHCPILDQDGESAAGLPYKLELPGNYHTCPAALKKRKKKHSLRPSDRRGSALTDSCNASVDRQEKASWRDAVESGKARLALPRRAGPAHPSGLPYAPHIAMLL